MTSNRYNEKAPSVGCKCGARTYNGHLTKVSSGYPGHVYRGPDAGSAQKTR